MKHYSPDAKTDYSTDFCQPPSSSVVGNCRSDIALSYTQAIPTNFRRRQDKSLHMQGSF